MAEFSEVQTIEIVAGRYDDLLAKEEKLRLIENALKNHGYTISTSDLCKMFSIERDS